MKNRYVIALNHLKIAKRQFSESYKEEIENQLSQLEVERIMDVARKYPEQKIEHKNLFTCGFSMN